MRAKTTHEDGSFWDYGYDGRYRLTSAVRSNANETMEANYAYTYDDGDNLLSDCNEVKSRARQWQPAVALPREGRGTAMKAGATCSKGVSRYHAQPCDTWRRGRFRFAATAGMTPGTAGTIAKANTDADLELRFTYVNNDTSDNGYYLIVGPRYGTGGDRIYLNILRGSINLAQRVSGVWTGLVGAAVTTEEGVEYTIRVVCDDSDVKVYRAAPDELEELVLETSNCTMTYTNYVTFTPSTDADFEIDNIRILSDDLSNTTTFAVNNANELTSMTDYNGSTTFGFDDWGRMTSKARGSYEAEYGYKYADMMTSLNSDYPGESNYTYEYGGNGKRISWTRDSAQTKFRWGKGMSLVNEEDGSGELTLTYFGYCLGAAQGANPATGSWVTYSLDKLGTVHSVRNSSKVAVSQMMYSPFGEKVSAAGTYVARGYTGHYDDGSGHLYHYYRDYFPKFSRWTVRDPLGPIDGPNLYSYSRGNKWGQ